MKNGGYNDDGRVGAGKNAKAKGDANSRAKGNAEAETQSLRSKHDKHPMHSGKSCRA